MRPVLLLLLTSQARSAFVTTNNIAPKFTDSHISSRNDGFKLAAFDGTDSTETASMIAEPQLRSRRDFAKRGVIAAMAASLTLMQSPQISVASDVGGNIEEELIDVYFGCGCFWHVQHEFVEAEKKILGRTDEQLTARAGYAGGKAGALDGKVCYHNALNVADYGKLGHAEVVSLRIPPSKFKDFAVEYFKLFDKEGNRPDQFGDRGTEYRNVVGIPGGSKSEFAKELIAASIATGDKLDFAIGKGDDRDSRKVSYVMDTATYPFFIGEQYHQFHDGFNLGENYPGKYNDLAKAFAKSGESFGACPNGSLGLGVGGL
mmetsp:Transcript_41672/g.61171  ORF Transcript_41672/g.61171 Transcript_41672/m.61171 type:complete len:317 (+) Transcript_41672:48-998(+)|eukprot:CAMPEP_0195526620 /NCGR_PEP_ID=MMETSP0794_2-20130614/27786_1 /TAXON_ID=515487 /ORGANISM="Stephanopyxis turris, Strain CCMP 815" /LENGTH=316 /DNA_ID=CAMNT_0040657355 /DNA_START=38 /DNA_END=988 /DNA_ORIENTATION=+